MMDLSDDFDEEYNADEIIDTAIPISDSDNDEDTDSKMPKLEFNKKVRTEMINKRTEIENIKINVINKLEIYDNMKGELETCNNHILELTKEEELTLEAIEINKQSNNIASVYRLQGQLKRIQIEIESENDVLNVIKEKLNVAEQEYIKSQMLESNYLLQDYALQDREKEYEEFQHDNYGKRCKTERKLAENALKSLDVKKSELSIAEKQHNEILQHQLNDITKSHEQHSKYLRKTMHKKARTEAEEHERLMREEEKRLKSFTKLNTDIKAIKENMSAIKAKKDADQKIEMNKEEELKRAVVIKGGNPLLEARKLQNQKKLKLEKEKFESQISENKIKIAAKIAGEETNMQKKKKLQPYLFTNPLKPLAKCNELPKISSLDIEEMKETRASKERPVEVIETWKTWDIRSDTDKDSCIMANAQNDNKSTLNTLQSSSLVDITNNTNIDTNINSCSDSDDELDSEDIRKPEFDGLWDKSSSGNKDLNDTTKQNRNKPNASKMEKDIMARVLKQLRENMIAPQVVNGKTFHGQVFHSKPNIVKFEDLEVGEQYSQTVTLTNTSYCMSQCRYESMSDNLLDFVNVKFAPSGVLSPGMTCEFTVFFEPKLNMDIYGELYFCSKSEKFAIPVACLVKKTKMSISGKSIKFGTTIIEEVLTHSILLKNTGAKGTYCFLGRIEKEDKTEEEYISDEDDSNEEQKKELKELHEKRREPKEDEVSHIDDADYDDSDMSITLTKEKLWIDGFSEQEIIIKWNPQKSGEYNKEFYINFDDSDNEGFSIICTGKALDVPVYTKQPVLVMDICMMDRLYQDSIVFHSRAAIALKLQFHVPNCVRQYLEILPNSGFIQAGQSLKAQLKLLPRPSINDEVCPYFDKETGVFSVPITASIAGQVKPVEFNVTAVLTGTDLQLSICNNQPVDESGATITDDTCVEMSNMSKNESEILDFGLCSIRETRIKQIKLKNSSLLPQEFGFTGYPQCVEVQPNFGYGTILPGEELYFDVLFSPTKADDYHFKIQCQTLIDRKFNIDCRGVGVHPNLEITPRIVQLPYTSLGDVTSTTLLIENSHTSTNIYTHEPPRIGAAGEVCRVGVRTFCFRTPSDDDSSVGGVMIHPRVCSVAPGQKQKVTLIYEPALKDWEIQQESAKLETEKLTQQAQKEWEKEVQRLEEEKQLEETIKSPSSSKRKKSAKKPANNKDKSIVEDQITLEQLLEQGPKKIDPIDPDCIEIGSDNYMKGRLSLLTHYKFKLDVIKIKCLVAEGELKPGEELKFDEAYTNYVEIHCPSVRPDLVILSDFGRQIIDFGNNIVQRRISKNITVKNISGRDIKMKSSSLHPDGTFELRTALRIIRPSEICNLLLSYTPSEPGIHQTDWQIYPVAGTEDTGTETEPGKKLSFRLKGRAKLPEIKIPDIQETDSNGSILDCGKILTGEYLEKPLVIENHNDFPLQLSFKLESQSDLLNINNQRNLSGLSSFDISPQTLEIEPGKSKSITITFAPDHNSDYFEEIVQIFMFNEILLKEFKLIGQSKPSLLFLYGPDRPISIDSKDYLGEIWHINKEETPSSSTKVAFVLELVSEYEEDNLKSAQTHFTIGCSRSMQQGQKKSGEFSIDNVNALTPLGLQIEPAKGTVEAGVDKQIILSWNPPANTKMGQILEANLNVSLKGEVASNLVIDIRAVVR